MNTITRWADNATITRWLPLSTTKDTTFLHAKSTKTCYSRYIFSFLSVWS